MKNSPTFEHPGRWYGSFPFWAWNDRLDGHELVRQIAAMDEQHIGGFFMHSRDGLETPYMGEDWKRFIRGCVEEAKKRGMYAWLYDEDRWPSGTAGGQVTARGDAYRCKGLTLEVADSLPDAIVSDLSIRAIYITRIDGMDIHSLRRISIPSLEIERGSAESGVQRDVTKNEDETYLIAREEVSGPSEWFNNQAPPDNLNPDTVRLFIELTHQKYADIVGDDFGKTIPGIFTDEPSLADRHASFHPRRGWLPWTSGFTTFYAGRRNADILDTLPYIYFNGIHSTKARHDYWKSISELFVEAYSGTVGSWCRKHGLAFTGHFLQEDKLGLATRVNGAVMPHYYHQDVPGIDMLTERTVEYMTVRQCTSVARQFSKPVVLSEMYGCTGWDFTFEGQKWVGDWQFVLGITRRSQHLALYSLKGCRKRDYPPVFNYNTSWWGKNHVVEDYFSRLAFVLQQGDAVRSTLVIHPASTAWSRLGTDPYGNPVRRLERDVPAIDEYGYGFNSFLALLTQNHCDHDLGDEILMEQHGSVSEGRISIGSAVYETVILYDLGNLCSPTVKLLESFARQGGHVLLVKGLPNLLDGVPHEDIFASFPSGSLSTVRDAQAALAWLVSRGMRTVSVHDGGGTELTSILALLKENPNGTKTLFLVNNDRDASYEAEIDLPFSGEVTFMDALTGLTHPVPAMEYSGQGMRIKTFFAPCASVLYMIDPDGDTSARHSVPEKKNAMPELWMKLPSQASVTLDRENTLTLDMCTYSLDDRPWSGPMEIWQMQHDVRQKLGMRQVHRNGIEQRYKWVDVPHVNDGHILRFRIEFEVGALSSAPVYLAGELPEDFALSFNGEDVTMKPSGYFLDKAFGKLLLPPLRTGTNLLEFTCSYANRMELENWYLIGDFGVSPERHITVAPTYLSCGDWTSQGLLHYCGTVSYHYSFTIAKLPEGRLSLSLPEWKAVCITAVVNGHEVEIPWKAESIQDITALLREGANTLELKAYASPRNMLGPLHLKGERPLVTNDACFSPEPEAWTPEYRTVPYGLIEPPLILWTAGSID